MTRITSRFAMLIATAAVLPLVVYGVVSLWSLRMGTQRSVREGNLNVATRVGEQIHLYITNNVNVLKALGAELRGTHLEAWQQDRILKNYVLDFPEFRELTLFDLAGSPIVTSRAGTPEVAIPESGAPAREGFYISAVTIDDDLLPTTTIAIKLEASPVGEATGQTDAERGGWLVGELSLEQLWRMVDQIRVGREGYASLVSEDGRLLAHGHPDQKRNIASGRILHEHTMAAELRAGREPSKEYVEGTRTILATGALVKSLNWAVIVEQPTDEAYAITRQLERQLLVAIGVALLVTITFGIIWGRGFIRRVFALRRGTLALADGRLDERVAIGGQDELTELADAFNTMADRLVELQEDVRRQERQAMFGKIAAGLVHDLSHPIQNIGNSCKLILKMWEDGEYRDTFRRTVDRELQTVKRVLDDLKNIARPIPLERFPLELNRSVAEVVEAMQPHAEMAGLTLKAELSSEPLFIEGDVFALGRVYRNLIINAIQATAPGGLIVVTTGRQGASPQVRFYDTGCGIPADRLHAIFDDFMTTKRRGLGLGLAISKKIVEQLGGTVTVASEVGKGTTFVLEFPETAARPMPAAVAG
jgi:signal transduction histidine kinase